MEYKALKNETKLHAKTPAQLKKSSGFYLEDKRNVLTNPNQKSEGVVQRNTMVNYAGAIGHWFLQQTMIGFTDFLSELYKEYQKQNKGGSVTQTPGVEVHVDIKYFTDLVMSQGAQVSDDKTFTHIVTSYFEKIPGWLIKSIGVGAVAVMLFKFGRRKKWW